MPADPLDRAEALIAEGRLAEALEITAPLAEAPDASHLALAVHSSALKADFRHEEALGFDRQAAQRFPASPAAWHNLAATLGDLGRGEEALEALAKGFAIGLDTPFSWKVKARAHIACGDVGAADAAFREAVGRAPAADGIASEHADLVWMASGDMAGAQAVLDRAFHAGGAPVPLLTAKGKLLSAAGDFEGAAALLARAAAHLPNEPQLLLAAGQAALEADRLEEAEALALRANQLTPGAVDAAVELAMVQLALGKSEEALATMRPAYQRHPADQSVLAWTATAARAAGDPLYPYLCDYESMVGIYELEPPPGWDTLHAFLAALSEALDRHHVMKQHPSAQSLRHGTQTTYRLTGSKEPAIAAFFAALDAPIRAHMARLGKGEDPLRRRNTGAYRFSGAWSVRLRQSGFHVDHLHHEGWLSSAFYVELPREALAGVGKEGWLRLGRPPYRTQPPLPAERFVRPEPGRLALFPSYMWHGTMPFTTDEQRTTIAFDLLPG